MKILLVHNRYKTSNIGGEYIVYDNEVMALRKMHGYNNIFTYEVCNDDINILKLLKLPFEILFSFKHYKNIKNITLKNHIDMVHVHNFFPSLTPSVFKAAKDCGAKVVHTLHNYRLWCISGIFYRDNIGICELCIKKNFH